MTIISLLMDIRKTFIFLGRLLPKKATRLFVEHNQHYFSIPKSRQSPNPKILMELNSMHSGHIAYSYLANVLSSEHNAEIVAYVPYAFSSVLAKLAHKIRFILNIDEFGIYKSFGTSDFMTIKISKIHRERARVLFSQIYPKIQSKWDIEAISIHGILVGDLIYDTYLQRFCKPTINKLSDEFKAFFLESIELFLFWEDFFNSHDVRAISVSHCVYNIAIPLRIAVEKNIPAYQATLANVYSMSKKNLFAYNDFLYFRERFIALPEEVKRTGLSEAKRRIDRRLSGEIGVNMSYSTKSAYSHSRHARLIRESPRKKILIATHCFFDSPHSYGNNIFPDFYEWLNSLGQISEITNYDWYIKTHPDYLQGTKLIIDSFVEKYPKFSLLPAGSSHHQIIEEGIDVALTVYGTIAFEYAALGIPVINNSLNNPHIAYDFNVHPKSLDNYRSLLMDLDNLKLAINKEQVYEYYYMKHIHCTNDIFFKNYDAMIIEIGGYASQFSPIVYAKWINEWSLENHKLIIQALQCFIRSGDFRMDLRQLDCAIRNE